MPGDAPGWTQTDIIAVDGGGNELSASAKWRADDPSYELVIDAGAAGTTHHRGPDVFDCLTQSRRELERVRLTLLCNGARIDAYPSGMARDMSAGLKVYIRRLGERGGELVDTFGPAPRDAVGTVAAQEEFHRAWSSSVKRS